MSRLQIALATALLLLARAAYGEPVCVTRCGLKGNVPDCDLLREIETRTLHAFNVHVPEWPYADACLALSDWKVFVHQYTEADRKLCPKGGFTLRGRLPCFSGFTHVFTHELEVESAEWDNGTFSHELVHAMQVNFGDLIGHCTWSERGILRALRLATGRRPLYQPGDCSPISELENYR